MKKIVIIGPESTGKSMLCTQLAQHYKTLWVPEYARQYLLENGTNYTYDDLLDIAKGQVALEEAYTKSFLTTIEDSRLPIHDCPLPIAHSPLFIDTDMYVMKVWCEFVFEQCHMWILNQVVERRYDLYLLCNTDISWVKDELREYPDLKSRETLYHIYKDIMVNQTVPWINISGGYDQRLQKAVQGINRYLSD